MDKMDKRQADRLVDRLAAECFPMWTDPVRDGELSAALHGKSAAELFDGFTRAMKMMRELEDYAAEMGDLAGSLVFGQARESAAQARLICREPRPNRGPHPDFRPLTDLGRHTDSGPRAVPNVYSELDDTP
jgi:hypothetical protein